MQQKFAHGALICCSLLTMPVRQDAPAAGGEMHAAVLRYIVEVARQGSIRKAGAALNVASSGINRQILNLEQELGVRIFDRTPDGVHPTDAGQLLLKHANQTLMNFEALRPLISDVREMRSGHISVSCINSLNFRIVPEIISRFSTAHPKVTLTIRQTAAEDVVQSLEEGYADIGFTFTDFDRQSIRLVKDIPSPFGAVVSPDHALARETRVSLRECLEYKMVKHYDPDGRTIFLDEIAKREALEIDTFIYTNSMVLAKQIIARNGALGIYIRHGALNEIADGILKFIPIDHPSLAAHRIGIYIPSTRHINLVERHLVNTAIKVFSEYA